MQALYDDVPEAVLIAMETEDEPLPDCVAAAWEKSPSVSVPQKRVLEIIEGLLQFPYPQICRHSVACSLLSALCDAGYPVTQALAGAVVDAEDEKALLLLRAKGN